MSNSKNVIHKRVEAAQKYRNGLQPQEKAR